MSTLYPMDFHRRVDRRWAERMTLATGAWLPGSRPIGKTATERDPECEGVVDPLPQSDAAQRSQRRRRMGHSQGKQT